MTNEHLDPMTNERFNLPIYAGLRVEIAEAVLQDYLALHATCMADFAEIETTRSGVIAAAMCVITFSVVLAAYSWLI
jgi:hypothetical protein